MTYSYHIDGPLPLSGKIYVSRQIVDEMGKKKFDKELCPRSLKFVEYTGKGENGFTNTISAANALATALGKYVVDELCDPGSVKEYK